MDDQVKMDDKVNLSERISRLEPNRLDRVGRMNDINLFVMMAKQGELVDWHVHDDTDDFFFVVSGQLTIQLRDRNIVLGPGELYVIPCGVEHCPRADVDSEILVLAPDTTTGAVKRPADS